MKRCPGCGLEKPERDFYRKRSKPRSRCMVCVRAEHRARYWKNPEPRRATALAYYYNEVRQQR